MNGLDIVIFELAGKPVLLIDLVSSVLGLTCVFLAGRNSKYNFWVGYLYTTALFLLFWNKLYDAVYRAFVRRSEFNIQRFTDYLRLVEMRGIESLTS